MLLKVDVEGIESETIGGIAAAAAIEVHLERGFRARRGHALPSRENIPTGKTVTQVKGCVDRRENGNNGSGPFPFIPPDRFALDGQ